ncbi:amidohydrolase [Acidimangrovimonas sediminis]|uniref:amidohydrolase n=1 Tax=Acidimangrovimonas sediminis TaxID=2056283 RepID=UPI000C80D3DC|nr:amidohydrolase [Acidimangrovimonas sediminis]
MTAQTTIFSARAIRTMSRAQPLATHVAVRDGRILAVGTLAECQGWGPATLDKRFADKVLMPGFVEAHGHAMEGSVWRDLFLGYFHRHAPEGELEGGLKDVEAVIARLKERETAMEDPDAPLLAWGFDPIYFAGARLTRHDLDRVSTTRPILIIHASFHIMSVNTPVLEMAGMFGEVEAEGILRDAQGDITGELQEMATMFLAQKAVGAAFGLRDVDVESVRRYGRSAVNAGVTTAADLHQTMTDQVVMAFAEATSAPDYPLRVVPAMGAIGYGIEEGVARATALRQMGNERFYPGLVKIMTDGSIQGFTARVKWPGYYNGAPNGMWNLPPATLKEMIKAYNAAGLQMHLHVNGDQASEFVIDTLAEGLREAPFPDHRHVLQHCQMADRAQFRKARALDLGVNLFANHIYYWGDQHYALTMGPERANRMDACGSALAEGLVLAIHSDVPVTPLGPLFTAWCAVNRQTATGRILGPEERITVEQAMEAITLGAAWQLKLDHLVGSIEVGKFADFAVLDRDPFETAPEALRDIRVEGTVSGGLWHESAIPA